MRHESRDLQSALVPFLLFPLSLSFFFFFFFFFLGGGGQGPSGPPKNPPVNSLWFTISL